MLVPKVSDTQDHKAFLEEHKKTKEEILLTVSWFQIRETFCHLEQVSLHLSEFKNEHDLTFQGRLTLVLDLDFINAEKVKLVAKKGLSIGARAIDNKGILSAKKASVILAAPSIDNSHGQVKSDLIYILNPEEVASLGFNNSNGTLVGEHGIYICHSEFKGLEKNLILSPQGPVKIYTQYDLKYSGLIDGASGINLESAFGIVQLNSAKTNSRLKISSGSHTLIDNLDYTAAENLEIKSNRAVNLTNSTLHTGVTLTGVEMVRFEYVNILAANHPIIASSDGIVALSSSHIQEASTVDFIGVESQLLESTFETVQGINITADVHTWQNVTIAVSDGGLKVNKGDLAFTDVSAVTKGSQEINVKVIDLENVTQKSTEGHLKLESKIFKASRSEFESGLKTVLKAKKLHADSFTVIAKKALKASVLKEAKLVDSHLKSDKKIGIASKKSYLYLSHADLNTPDLALDSPEQIQIPDSTFWIGRNASVVTETGWISAERSKWQGENSSSSTIDFKAEHGSVTLDDVIMDTDQKVTVLGKRIEGERSDLKNKRGVSFAGARVRFKEAKVESEDSDVGFKGMKSLMLEKVTIAAKGQIEEISYEWMREKAGSTTSTSISRESPFIAISNSNDHAIEIKSQASETIQLEKYTSHSETIELSSTHKISSQESQMTAPATRFRTDELWQKGDRLHFDELEVNAENLHQEKTELKGNKAQFDISESAFISESEFEIQSDGITSQTLLFKSNKHQGSLSLQSEQDQVVYRNRMNKGDLHLDSARGDIHMSRNIVDVQEVSVEGKQVDLFHEQIQTEKNLSLNSQHLGITLSNLQSNESIQAHGRDEATISRSTLAAEAEATVFSEDMRIQQVHLDGKRSTQFAGANADLKQVHIKSESGQITMDLEKAALDEVTFSSQGVDLKGDQFSLRETAVETGHFSQDIKRYTSEATSTKADVIERRSETMHVSKGRDKASSITETAKEAVKHAFLTRGNTITENIDDLTLFQSAIEGSEVKVHGDELKGRDSALRSTTFDLETTQVRLNTSELITENATLKVEQAGEFSSSTLEGNVKIEGQLSELSLESSDVKGSLIVDSQAEIYAPNLTSTEEALSLTGKNLFLPNLQAEVEKEILLQGQETTYMSNSHLSVSDGGLSVESQNIIAQETEAKAKETISLKSEQTIGLKKSEFESQTTVAYEAGSYLDHREATTAAPITFLNTPYVNNNLGHLRGNLSAEVPLYFDNVSGEIELGPDGSQIETKKIVSSSESKIIGPGSIQIKSLDPHVEESLVNVEGTYQVQAPAVDIDTDVEAGKVHLYAQSGKVTVEEGRIINIATEGLIDAVSVDNLGQIISDESLIIHQENFKSPGIVKGRTNLTLSSTSSLHSTQPIDTPGDLLLASKAEVKTFEPIKTGGKFTVDGSKIDLNNDVEAADRASLHSQGPINFHKITAVFKKGISANATVVTIYRSNVEITGDPDKDSIIDCETFLVKSEVIYGRRNSPYRYHHIPSNFNHEGDFNLIATEKAANFGSNVMIDGNLKLGGKDLENFNNMHLFWWIEEAGTYSKRRCHGMGKKKKKTLYVQRCRWIEDGHANFQVRATFFMELLGNIRSDGSILANAFSIERARSLFNGIFTSIGETPTSLPPNLPHFPELPALVPGGQFQATTSMEGHFDGIIHTNGTFGARTVSVWLEKFLVEKRVIKRLTQVANYKRFGRVSVRWEEEEVVQPGGLAEADEMNIHVGTHGVAIRGADLTVGKLFVEGGSYALEALPIKTITHLNPGRVSPLKRGAGWAEKTVYHQANAICDEVLMRLNGPFRNIASNMFSRNMDVEAHGVDILTLAKEFVHTRKMGWTRSKTLRRIEKAEPQTMAIEKFRLISTIHMILEGTFGSYQEKPEFEAVTIHLRSRSFEAKNTVKADIRFSGIGLCH